MCKHVLTEQLYTYLGDRLTRAELRGARCRAILDARGKCIRGRNGNMAVRFESGEESGETCIVLGRRLRKVQEQAGTESGGTET